MKILSLFSYSILLFLVVLPTLFSGCKNPSAGDDGNKVGYRLYAGYEGNLNHGILIIDLESFAVVDSILLEGVPFDLSLSSDSSLLFVATSKNITVIDLPSQAITEVYDHAAFWLGTSIDDGFIFSGNTQAFSVIDRQTNEVIFRVDSLRVLELVADPLMDGAYVAYNHPDSQLGTGGIFHYDLTSNTIDKTYELVYGPYQSGFSPADMAVSHDGKRLFLSNMGSGVPYLHVFDLETGAQVARVPISGAANLAVTSDDRYVYITDPGVHLSIYRVPSGILLRYRIASNSIEQYLDFKTFEISEYFNGWPEADQIALMPGSEIAVISSWSHDAITVWDLAGTELLGKVEIGKGKHTQLVHALALGPIIEK